MEPSRLQEIVKALEGKGAKLPCPRCGGKQFGIIEETRIDLQTSPGFSVGGPAIPVVLVGCNQCGCVFSHAIQLLGLKPKVG